jgi:hypothetical protein
MPDPTLQGTALRYAAGDLAPVEAEAFEARLAEDQDARDALAEAVRLSAAAIGQKPPAPHPSFRAAIRARLTRPGRAGARGHPLAWVGLGAAAAAACTLLGLTFAQRGSLDVTQRATPHSAPARPEAERAPNPHAPDRRAATAPAPMPREADVPVAAEVQAPATCGDESRSVAEIWADLSTPEHVEKARDEELRWRQHVRNLSPAQHVSAAAKAAVPTDGAQP